MQCLVMAAVGVLVQHLVVTRVSSETLECPTLLIAAAADAVSLSGSSPVPGASGWRGFSLIMVSSSSLTPHRVPF